MNKCELSTGIPSRPVQIVCLTAVYLILLMISIAVIFGLCIGLIWLGIKVNVLFKLILA